MKTCSVGHITAGHKIMTIGITIFIIKAQKTTKKADILAILGEKYSNNPLWNKSICS